MDINFLVILLWTTTVYQLGCATTRDKPKRNHLSESEPHPYTISFFTFPNGAASDIIKSKTQSKRQNADLQSNENATIPSAEQKIYSTKSAADSKTTKNKLKTAGGNLEHTLDKTKHPKPFVQVYEKPSAIEKVGKAPEVGPEKGHQKTEPLILGSSHYKIQHKLHHMETDDAYQTGSINHPSHTMYPECHYCPSNSTYDECISKNTLKCNKGLNNICFTKSFTSRKRGIVYEMGCSNHHQCRNAKASPCKGNKKKCFVCCQYDRCNAVPHHNLYASESSDETGFELLNSKSVRCVFSKWDAVTLVSLQLMLWMLS